MSRFIKNWSSYEATTTEQGPDDCVLCHQNVVDILNLGEIKKTGKYSAHYYCLLLASNIKQSGQDEEGILGFLASDISDELRASASRMCTYCKKKGATINCATKNCQVQFHLPCGMNCGTSHQFHDRFLSHCMLHRPRQKYGRPREPHKCPICYEEINFIHWTQVLWAPCCKKSSYFHKPCLQQMALSAGYFFKCPCCNDNTVFQRTMKHYGVFIPDRDASWELVPNAYQELLYRHEECNAKACLCAKGRSFSGTGIWAIVLCDTCGSNGTHISCSHLKRNATWYCIDCTTRTPEKPKTQNVLPSTMTSDPQPSTSHQSSRSQQYLPPSSSTINCIKAMTNCTQANADIPASVRNIIPQSYAITIHPIPGPSTLNGDTQIKKRKRQSSQTDNSASKAHQASQLGSVATVNITRVQKVSHSSESISVDSDSDVVVVDDDEEYKCLKTKDGSFLTVRKIIPSNNRKIIAQGDLEISEPAKTPAQAMNFVITDVRSIREDDENRNSTATRRVKKPRRKRTCAPAHVNGNENGHSFQRFRPPESPNENKSVSFADKEMHIYQGVVYNSFKGYSHNDSRNPEYGAPSEESNISSKQQDPDVVVID